MSERTKLIILLSLIGILAVVFVLGRFGLFGAKHGRVPTQADAQSAQVGEPEARKPLPTVEEFTMIADWLAPAERTVPASVFEGKRSSFGLALLTPEEEGKRKELPLHRPFMVNRLKLQGTISLGGVAEVLIDGESYGVGQRVRGTDFTVVEIGTCTVKLRTDRGQVIVLDLSNRREAPNLGRANRRETSNPDLSNRSEEPNLDLSK